MVEISGCHGGNFGELRALGFGLVFLDWTGPYGPTVCLSLGKSGTGAPHSAAATWSAGEAHASQCGRWGTEGGGGGTAHARQAEASPPPPSPSTRRDHSREGASPRWHLRRCTETRTCVHAHPRARTNTHARSPSCVTPKRRRDAAPLANGRFAGLGLPPMPPASYLVYAEGRLARAEGERQLCHSRRPRRMRGVGR